MRPGACRLVGTTTTCPLPRSNQYLPDGRFYMHLEPWFLKPLPKGCPLITGLCRTKGLAIHRLLLAGYHPQGTAWIAD